MSDTGGGVAVLTVCTRGLSASASARTETQPEQLYRTDQTFKKKKTYILA